MSLFTKLRTWFLTNTETFQTIEGQFEATGVTESGWGGEYAEHFSLNAAKAITQFLHGQTNKITFQARLRSYSAIDFSDIEDTLNNLKVWSTKLAGADGHPPILTFWIGDAHIQLPECVIESLGDIQYDQPTAFGGLRGCTFTITLREYVPFSLDESFFGETRYHRARRRDYYEALTLREYGDPMLGDVIRKRHPDKPNIQAGDVIKLPDKSTLRTAKVKQTSLALKTGFDKEDTAQKRLRKDMLDKRNRPFVSHVILDL
jgi:hypothetical protein